jgi:transcriptional regulator with XRE-family HTH domain
MPRRGYPIEGPRAGGLSRLADDANISRAALSRIMSGHTEPSLDTMRALATCLGYELEDILRFAGVIGQEGDRPQTPDSDVPRIGAEDWWVTTPPPDLRVGTDWESLPHWARWLWQTPGLEGSVKWKLVRFVQAEQEAADVDAQIRSGVHSPAEKRIIKGANGA